MSDCRLLVRPRLLEKAAERWTRRVVSIVAGPGFGKSVLLAQLQHENRLAPRGAELVVACRGDDGAPGTFLGRLADALDRAGSGRAPVPLGPGPFVAELARRWPLGLCVVLDDVHHVTATREGARLLGELVAAAPPPVHFVLAGRRPLAGLATLRAQGEVLDLGEHDLALSPSELCELAEAHGTDLAVLGRCGGWPAVASVSAAFGVDRGGDYVWEAVLDHLDEAQRRVLAVAATIGSCDRRLLAAAIGAGTDDEFDLLADLPLVARRDGELVVHDLWRRAVEDALTDDERHDVVARAANTLVARHDYDRARRLCTTHERWEEATLVLRACCRPGYADVAPHVLAGWLESLPAERWDEPDGLLLRALVARNDDPFGPDTSRLLERAVADLRAVGDVTGEITMINELAYVLRNQGRGDEIPGLVARAAELQAAGHRGADGLVAMAHSVCAELSGDIDGMITSLDGAALGSLSREWQALFAFRRATGLLTIGDERELLAVATRCAELAGDTTLRHAAALAHWYAGDHELALATLDEIVADCERTKVDGVALGAFATMVQASVGRLDEAARSLAATLEAAGDGPLVPLMAGYLVGIQALEAAARGDDAAARRTLEQAMADAPLDTPVGWLAATRWLALAYVLVPSCRPAIDAVEAVEAAEAAGPSRLGPLHARRLRIARAVVAAAEGGRLTERDVAGLTPSAILTTVPLPWAMLLAARLHGDGNGAGRELASWLTSRFNGAARDALRLAAEHPRAGCGARKLLAAIPVAPGTIRLGVLGPTTLDLDGEVGPDWQRERVRSLLLYLVVNGPSRREAITDALWPELDPASADRNLRVTLSYLQRVLEPERRRGEAPFFLRQDGAAVVLAGAPHVLVDVTAFEQAAERAEQSDRRGASSVARAQYAEALDRWRGPCFADVAYEEWVQPVRQECSERFVRAAVRAAELALSAGDLSSARACARRALAVDDWSEPAHRVLIAAALAEGDHAGAARAVTACERALDELGVVPGPETQMLVRRIRAPRAAVA